MSKPIIIENKNVIVLQHGIYIPFPKTINCSKNEEVEIEFLKNGNIQIRKVKKDEQQK